MEQILCHLLVSGLLKGAVGTIPITSLTVRTFGCADSVQKDKYEVNVILQSLTLKEQFTKKEIKLMIHSTDVGNLYDFS